MNFRFLRSSHFQFVSALAVLGGNSAPAIAGQITLASGTFQVSDVAGEQILLSAPEARVARDQAIPAPACADLYAKLEQDRANIERCLSPNRPLNYCKLLEGGWRRVLLGIENEPMGTFAPDAEQHWTVRVVAKPVAPSATAEASAATSIPVQAFVSGQTLETALGNISVNLAPNSWSRVIDRLPDAQVHPVVTMGQDQFKTRNRLLACDILRGDGVITGDVEATYQANVVDDPGSVQPLWTLYQDLRNSQSRFPQRRDRLIAYGFDATHFLFEQNSRAEIDEVRSVLRTFVPGNESTGELNSYVNSFDLGRALPRKNVSLRATWPVSLNGRDGAVNP